MNQETPDLSKASLNEPNADSLGGYLRAKRLEKKWHLNDVSDYTKYHVYQLQAVEDEHWDKLPTGFVLRSIVKKFAVAVDADEVLALEKLSILTGNTAPVSAKQLKANLKSSLNVNVKSTLLDTSTSRGSGTLFWILLIFIVLGVVAYIAFSQGMFNLNDIEFLKKWFS